MNSFEVEFLVLVLVLYKGGVEIYCLVLILIIVIVDVGFFMEVLVEYVLIFGLVLDVL